MFNRDLDKDSQDKPAWEHSQLQGVTNVLHMHQIAPTQKQSEQDMDKLKAFFSPHTNPSVKVFCKLHWLKNLNSTSDQTLGDLQATMSQGQLLRTQA